MSSNKVGLYINTDRLSFRHLPGTCG